MWRGWIACVGALLAVATACGRTSTELPARAWAPMPTEAKIVEPAIIARLSSAAYELAYDSTRNVLWFAELSRVGDDRLWRVSLESGTTTAFALPPVAHNGFTTSVYVARDGAVWVSLPHQVARLRPGEDRVRSVDLDSVPPKAPVVRDEERRWRSGPWTVDYDSQAGVLVRSAPGQPSQLLRLHKGEGTFPKVERVTDLVLAEDGTAWILRADGQLLAEWPA